MDYDVIGEPLLDRCKGFIENILQTPELQRVASASLAIFTQIRQVARDMLQIKITVEAQQRMRVDVPLCCPGASLAYVHTRTVRPQTLLGEITIPVRTLRCQGCGATVRPDDAALGVPTVGAFTDDVRRLYAPLAAELPHRVANTLFARCTGLALSSCGAPGIIDCTAKDLRTWQAAREGQQVEAVGQAVAAEDTAAELRVEIAIDGVTAHIDGRWPQPKVSTLLVRRLEAPAEEPTLGAVLARRYVSVLGAADDLAVRVKQVRREAGWEHIPVGKSWAMVRHGSGIWRRRMFRAFAHLLYPHNPAGAKAWVDQRMGALLTDRVGEVLSALKRMRPWAKAICHALTQLIGYVEHNRTRIRYQEPWRTGLAVGSGAVEGARKPVIQRRFTRAGMRWKQSGFLNVLALRLASLNGTFEAFWASRGLAVHGSVAPTT